MSDFEGLLSSDFGYKPQGKSAPMSAPRASSNSTSRSFNSSRNFDLGSSNFNSDSMFSSRGTQKTQNGGDFDDLFGGPPKRTDKSLAFDSMFGPGSKPPVYDKPLYDDDIFEGVPGIKSFSNSSSGRKNGDVFESISGPSAPPDRKDGGSSAFDDLLGGFGKADSLPKSKDTSKDEDKAIPEFDDLIPGFEGSSPASQRSTPTWPSEPVATSRKTMEDPFADLACTPPHVISSSAVPSDPSDNFNDFVKSGGTKADGPSVSSGVVYDDLDLFDGFPKPVSTSSSDTISSRKDASSVQTDRGNGRSQSFDGGEQVDQISPRGPGSHSHKSSADNDLESHRTFFDMSSASNSFSEPADQSPSAPYDVYTTEAKILVQEENVEPSDEVWLSVSEIPLFTRPTSAPPPARFPPPRPTRAKMGEFYGNSNFEVPKSAPEARPATLEELEKFAMGMNTGYNVDAHANGFSSEEPDPNSDAVASAAAMKEAMDRAEAKFRHGKEVRERESTRAARSRDSVQLENDESWLDAEERVLRERQEQLQREREEEEKERFQIEKEREREEKEREQRRLEKDRERAREERERARQAVERATREARERAAAEARAKAERAAVGKANAEARERAERAAVMRAQAEARERAAADARERVERAAAEAKEREARERAAEASLRAERAEKETAEAREKEVRETAVEARRRAERAAFQRAAAEARQRAAAEARDRAAAAARANQQKNDNDLDSFFNVPRPRTNPTEPSFDAQSPTRKGAQVARTSGATVSSMRKASPSANFVDDLSSIFRDVPRSGDFQEIQGESEERRRARLERQQRTQERAAKALAEKNQRDLQAQREQAERHRIGESLDVEIKRWAAGKEGNLRALLSTLQYVLWPECGWQPVSLTDLIIGASVKKVYRKATLCIHPDKVQQKGANLQQKYIAEKVFDLLKEAWNKFNSEELF